MIALPNRLPVVFCWVYAAQRGASSGARTNVSSCMGCGTGSSFTAAVTLCVAWHVSTLHATQRRQGYSRGMQGVLKGHARGACWRGRYEGAHERDDGELADVLADVSVVYSKQVGWR